MEPLPGRAEQLPGAELELRERWKNITAASSAASCAHFSPSAAFRAALMAVMVINSIFSSLLLLS